MGNKVNIKKLNELWWIIKNKKLDVTPDVVKELAREKNLGIISIEEVKFGFNLNNRAVFLETNFGTALYPVMQPDELCLYRKNKASAEVLVNFWRKLDWFFPPFVSMESVWKALEGVGITPKNYEYIEEAEAQAKLGQALVGIYTIEQMSIMTEQVFTESVVLKQYVPIIREAILAFYSGMKTAAIAALIPIVEGVLDALIDGESKYSDKQKIPEKINTALDSAKNNVVKSFFYNVDWFPKEFLDNERLIVVDERYQLLEAIKCWLKSSFYSKTDEYTNYSGFNRHYFAHCKSNIWQNQDNFFRAIGLLQALVFVEIFSKKGSRISLFMPAHNNASQTLYVEILTCMNLQAVKNTTLQKYQLDGGLPHIETASDNGWLLRAGLLSEKLNDVVIKTLAENGWQCFEFTDPVQNGEYVTVKATKNKKGLKIALLYSCATSNEIYKTLEQTCEYILYLGSTYKQHKYASGIQAQVMPLNAWIPPDN